MKITVRYFASLREAVGRDEAVLTLPPDSTAADVWAAAVPAAAGGDRRRVLVAINHEYADFAHAVRDGDEVAFFPPVTGG